MVLNTAEAAAAQPEVGKTPFIKAGYAGYTRFSFGSITVFNILLASFLLLLSLPVSILTALSIKLRDGGPIFYSGIRLGRHKKPFVMYKFRTLPLNANKIIGTDVLQPKHMLVTPFTRFLRDTRIDEIPQLWNILKGDMDFVGPRPIRPEVYETHCRSISNFDLRFIVRPGLIGYAQIFTPHSSPKRIRAIIDNKFVKLKRSLVWDIIFISYTIFVLLRRTLRKGAELFWNNAFKVKLLHKYQEQRALERIRLKETRVVIMKKDWETIIDDNAKIIDINYYYFRMSSQKQLGDNEYAFFMEKYYIRKHHQKRKIAHCTGDITKKHDKGNGNVDYIVKYEPTSDLNRYMIDQYMLMQSVANISQ